jgi:hypothetical protein
MRGPSIYDHSHTTRGSGTLSASPSGSTEFGRLPGGARAHGFSYVQHGALDSTHATRSPSIYDHNRTTHGSGTLPALPSGCARATISASTSAVATNEGCTGGTCGQSSSEDHAGEAGLSADRLTLSATSASTVLPVHSSVCVVLVDPNWHRAMEEEFAALIANNIWDLVPRPVGSNVVTDKWIFKHKLNSDGSLE